MPKKEAGTRAGGGDEVLVVAAASGAVGVPQTMGEPLGVMGVASGVFGGLGLKTPVEYLKVFHRCSERFGGLEKSVKVLRNVSGHAVFFGLGIAGGIGGLRWEITSRNE